MSKAAVWASIIIWTLGVGTLFLLECNEVRYEQRDHKNSELVQPH